MLTDKTKHQANTLQVQFNFVGINPCLKPAFQVTSVCVHMGNVIFSRMLDATHDVTKILFEYKCNIQM